MLHFNNFRLSLLFCILSCLLMTPLHAYINTDNVNRCELAFPGAEGFGAYSQGGRNGTVLKITTLEDDDDIEGSLRWAIKQDYPRIIEFDVEGIIVLEKDLKIENPFITIDGSTAPGEGITLKDGSLKIYDTNDVIVRYLRVRPGDEAALGKGPWEGSDRDDFPEDAITIKNSLYVIVDHCSASWSSDEVVTITGEESDHVTVQWCFITEPLANPDLHIEDGEKISHPFGSLMGGKSISYIKNLVAFFRIRAPQLGANDDSNKEAVNNYIYAYSNSGSRMKIQDTTTNYHLIGNYYRQSEKYEDENTSEIHILYSDEDDKGDINKPKLYIFDNLGPNRKNDSDDQWKLVENDLGSGDTDRIFSSSPLFNSPTTAMKSSDVPDVILGNGGATLPKRDCIDKRVIRKVKRGKGKIINGQDDVGGYCN